MNANVMCILRLYDPYMRIYNRWREGVVDRGMYPALRTRAAIRRWPAIGARTLRTRVNKGLLRTPYNLKPNNYYLNLHHSFLIT